MNFPRELDEVSLRLTSQDYSLYPIERDGPYVEAVFQRVRAVLAKDGSPSQHFVGRRGNDNEMALYRESDFWAVCHWERGRGHRPALFLDLFSAVRFLLLMTTGSDEMDWMDLPGPEGE